jgi:hypothetical protein
MNMRSSVAKRAGAALLVGAFALGAAACSSDPEDQIDQTEDQVEDRVDDVEEDVRENTP